MRGRGRGRGRGRPARPQFPTRGELINKNIFIKKPTYLREKEDGSRASTPGGIAHADSEDNVASLSRSSSVTRSSLGTTPRKKHKKQKVGASTSAEASQEYYYGSDFENLSDLDELHGDDDDSDVSDSVRSVYDADELVSESELSLPSSAGAGQDYVPVSRPPTPVPVWLQDREIPQLVLPPSSEDLLIPREHILQTCAVYEVLRHFRTQIFLSPFTLEDFSAALLAEQQSNLLSEVHFQMLRLIVRESEKEHIHFGPQDHKDSINSVLYLSDKVTWPETLRIYLHTFATSAENVREVLHILDNNEYPFVPFEERLKVLQVMVDMVLVTPIIRNEFQRDGPIVYDDHCRCCHKLGELLCCETCPATYHLECVDPPLQAVPDHDWQCEVCRKHQTKGVTDCVSDMERNGAMSRQEVLGYDRHGRRYWFLCRRIFVEDPESPASVVYYSTSGQYAALLSRLDRTDLEDALCMSLQELHYDIQRQMALTDEITQQRLRPGAVSYIRQENERLKAAPQQLERTPQDREDRAGEVKTEPDGDNTAEVSGGGGDAPSAGAASEQKTEEEDNKTAPAVPTRTIMVTRTKSGALPARTVVKEEDPEEEDGKPAGPFKLGDASDRAYLKYENQYSCNPLALNRFQAAEDKDKRRHMSHKFSLTQASEFHWAGLTCGSRQQLRQTLRQTLQELVSRLPQALMHPSWPQLRRAWTAAVTGSRRPQDFARALTVISALIRPRLVCGVWTEALSHVSVQRVTPLEREERKKAEKREKRERDEEELAQLRVPFVKYRPGKVKHQVWKQRGEEYRVHGQTGWLWLSCTRRYRPLSAALRGHAAGPHTVHLTVATPDTETDGAGAADHTRADPDPTAAPTAGPRPRVISVPFTTYRRLLAEQVSSGGPDHRLMSLRLRPGCDAPQPDRDAPCDAVTLAEPPALLQPDGVIDVSAGLTQPRRTQYPRSARPGRLDKLLAWREELERRERGEDREDAGRTEDAGRNREAAREELEEAEGRLALLTVYPCYRRDCTEGQTCYSPTCRQAESLKRRIEQLRTDVVKTEPDAEMADANADASADAKNSTNATSTDPNTNTNADAKTDDANKDAKTDTSADTNQDAKNSTNATNTDPNTNTSADAKTVDANKDTKTDTKPTIKSEPNSAPSPAKFANIPTWAPVKLEVIRPVVKKNYVRYPLYSKFRAGGRWSMLVLPAWELRQLARRRGQKIVDGFNYSAKNNSGVWPYPCPRASFRTGWLYRTCRVSSLHAAGLQLRILWACVRWDDIDSKPQQVAPGEFQITTDTGMVRSLILKHRDEGRFKERTMYYRRRVTILFDNPVIVEKEYTSSARSGLRKRRRVIESSENPSSAVTQEWVPEDSLEIFEIQYYFEKLERLRQERQQAALQKRTAALLPARSDSPATDTPGSPADNPGHNPTAATTAAAPATPAAAGTVIVAAGQTRTVTSAAQLKSKLEEAVRQSRSLGKGTKFMVKPSVLTPGTPGTITNPQTRTYTAMKKLITKDGRVIAIQSAPSGTVAAGTVTVGTGSPKVALSTAQTAAQSTAAPALSTAAAQSTAAPAQSTAAPAQSTAAAGAVSSVTVSASGAAVTGTPAKPAANQIQIIRLPDGKLQVKGLKPGQQLVQLPGGQLQLVAGGSAKSLQAVTKPATQPATAAPSAASPTKLRLVAPAGAASQSPVVSPVKDAAAPASSPQKVVQKMVTQVVDLAGLSQNQLVGWQKKINDGKAKLALVNGRRVILHNVLVNQSLSTTTTVDGPAGTSTITTATTSSPGTTAPLRPEPGAGGEDEDDPPAVASEEREDAAGTGAEERGQQPEAKSELSPGRRITATANIVQTVAGPRVVIQGVPTQGLSQSQLHNLQQQVKAELAKGPMLTGLREIHLTVPADVPDPPPAPAPAAPPATGQSLLQPGQSVLSPRRVSEPGPGAGQPEEPPPTTGLHQDFTVTQEYIQQSIANALNSDNLKPEIAEKLLQLRKKPAAPGSADGGGQTGGAPKPAGSGIQPARKPRPRPDRHRQPTAGRPKMPRPEKKSVRPSARLQQLVRRKEQLKKEILRKRLTMENHLQLDISRQLAAFRRAVAEEREGRERRGREEARRHRDRQRTEPARAAPVGRKSGSPRRKSEESRKRKSSTSRASPAAAVRPAKKARKEAKQEPKDAKKVYCICRQPYDPTKFYVGCDMCSNWYHGSCVGISQRSSKKLKAFVCQQCQSAKENRELFCFCRTEYDESQFYIGCDTCEDWFHGRCVGILPSEGDDIDDYVCPRCDPDSRINGPNFSPLSETGYAELRKVFKLIKNNKNAWPFIEPVDPDEVPNYYKVIKEPMDLQTMENRLDSRHYGRLCDFTGDMILLLDNCKYFNPPGTRLATCGSNLETFFRAELKKLRTKL